MHPEEVRRRLRQDRRDNITVSALLATLSLFALGASIRLITDPAGKAFGSTVSGVLLMLFVFCLIKSIRH